MRRAAGRQAMKVAGFDFDPWEAWEAVPDDMRRALRLAAQLADSLDELGGMPPPLYLGEAFRTAAAATGTPALLLAAVAAELSGFEPTWAAGGRAGVMGLPASTLTPDMDEAAQATLAGRILARWIEEDGPAAALERYTGTRAAAWRVVSTLALYGLRQLPPEARGAPAKGLALLEEGTDDG